MLYGVVAYFRVDITELKLKNRKIDGSDINLISQKIGWFWDKKLNDVCQDYHKVNFLNSNRTIVNFGQFKDENGINVSHIVIGTQ